MDDQTSDTSSLTSFEERMWATVLHLSAIPGLVILGGSFFFPLMIWRMRRKQSTFVYEHGKEAVNFQFTWLVISLLVAGGFLLLADVMKISSDMIIISWIINLVIIVCAALAAVKANKGVLFQYPLRIRLIK